MSLTKAKLEQYAKQGQASQELLKLVGKKPKKNLLIKQLAQTKKILNKL